jgi:hypothetical protein
MQLLFVAIHFISGQPARATELETITISNFHRQRSIFIDKGIYFLKKKKKKKKKKEQN